MKIGVKIKKGKVYISEYKKGEEYTDIIVDKYAFLRHPSKKRTLILQKTKREFDRFIKDNKEVYDYFVSKMKNIDNLTIISEPYHGNGYELITKNNKNNSYFILKTENGVSYLSTKEKIDKKICGYFEYVGESVYGFIYMITEDYSDNYVLLYRPTSSNSIDDDIIIDTNVNHTVLHDNILIYSKHIDNYFVPKEVYLYDLATGNRTKIFHIKNKDVKDSIDEIYYDNYAQRVIIVRKISNFRYMLYYDIKTKEIVEFHSYSKVSYDFDFNKNYVILLYTDAAEYNYLYVLTRKQFYSSVFKSNHLISVFSSQDKKMTWFSSNDRYLFYCFKDIETNYEIQIVDLTNFQKVYQKNYKNVENVTLYDNCVYAKDPDLVLKIKVIEGSTVTYVSIKKHDFNIKEEINEKNLYTLSYKKDKYVFKREYVNGIPVDIYYLDNKKNKKGAIVEVYGAYGHVINYSLSEFDYALLEEDYIIVIGRIRGGGDLGKKWHKEGKLMTKMNSINDTITVCEHISRKYFSGKNNIVLRGASAGGIAVGGALNKKPELFKGIILEMAFVDVLNTMLDESQMLTELEYTEWGNPKNARYYYYIKSYCPYTNIKSQSYPNVLIVTGVNDERVMLHEGLKFYMKLKEYNLSSSKILCHVTPSGHFIEDNYKVSLKRKAYLLTFIKYCLG